MSTPVFLVLIGISFAALIAGCWWPWQWQGYVLFGVGVACLGVVLMKIEPPSDDDWEQ